MTSRRLLDSSIVSDLVLARRIEDGKRIRDRRTALGLTLAQVAEMADLTKAALSRIETGEYTPRDAHKVAIAAALVQSINDLWKPLDVNEVRSRALENVA